MLTQDDALTDAAVKIIWNRAVEAAIRVASSSVSLSTGHPYDVGRTDAAHAIVEALKELRR